MKKVININFQGRVIPIEETAYELLKQYIESLRRYFINEEGKDEIINDIESRIAELFSERLKKGATCITDDDVNLVISGMGRPEDFDAQGADSLTSPTQPEKTYSQQEQKSNYTYSTSTPGRGRLYRNADDKILGGVCSGLANYLGIDPVVMRIIFVILIGALFWVYILLWIIVPSQSVQSNITKRLYRSTDDKVIGGVCGGLAVYFNMSPWIPRLIFALPLIIGLISGPLNFWWTNDMDFWWGPKVVTGSLGSTLFITYIILWISVPIATTAAEKLEMRGEKVDLNSIRNTVKEDMQSFKSKAQSWGTEVKQTAQEWGEKAKDFGNSAGTTAKTYAAEAGPALRQTRSGCGHILGVLFKAFFMFIAGIIAITLFGVFLGLLFGGFAVFPLKNFVLEGFWQNALAWSTLFLFFGIPIIALITWLIRRIMGVRSKNHYLGYVFGSLWVIGLVSAIILGGLFARNFKTKSGIEEQMTSFVQPATGKLYLDVATSPVRYYGGDWFGIDDDDWPVYGINQDTLMLNNVRVNLVKSKDSSFHIFKVRFSRGNNPDVARNLAEKIQFNLSQQDSTLVLPKGFAISRNDKFRNQQVLVVVEIPVGKRIQLDRSINSFEWFDVNSGRRRGWNFDWDDNWDYTYHWETNKEYIMTPDGLERVDKLDQQELKRGRFKLRIKDGEVDVQAEGDFNNDSQYRYQEKRERKNQKQDSVSIRSEKIPAGDNDGDNGSNVPTIKKVSADLGSQFSIFSALLH